MTSQASTHKIYLILLRRWFYVYIRGLKAAHNTPLVHVASKAFFNQNTGTNLGNLFLFQVDHMNQQTCNVAILITTLNIVPFAQNSTSYPVFTRYSYLVSCVASSASRRSIQVQWTNLSNDWAAKPFSEARTIKQIHSNCDSILIPGVINSSLLNPVSSIQQEPTSDTGSPSNPTIMDVSWYIIVDTSST